jgi:hypothetical protein
MRYSEYLTGKIGERIEKLHQKQLVALSLLDEVSVMHEIAGQAVHNYQIAHEYCLTVEDLETRMRLQHTASAYVIEALNHVRDMTVAAARVQDSGKAVDMQTIASAMAQLMVLMEASARRNLGDPEMFMKDMNNIVQEQFLTVDAIAKTSITPASLEQEMRAMVQSVPYVEQAAAPSEQLPALQEGVA